MPRRTFWLVTGAVAGVGSTLWAERKVRHVLSEAAARLQPDALASEVGRSARHVVGTTSERLRDAVTSGREEMHRKESELWQGLSPTGGSSLDAGPPANLGADPSATAPVGFDPVDQTSVRRSRVRVRRSGRKSPSHLG